MTEGQLLQTLKHCPLSATFGMSQDEIASNLSRVQLIVLIEQLIIKKFAHSEMVSVEERGSLSEKSSVRLNGELAPEEEKDVSDQNFKLEQSPDSVFDARPYTLKRYQGASAEMREDSSNEDLLIDDKEQISDNAGARLSIDKHQHQAQE